MLILLGKEDGSDHSNAFVFANLMNQSSIASNYGSILFIIGVDSALST